uniref:Uncharacterized protein n=1 Tax=Ovis aries TaxID=9940 RepID=A0AC11DS14_SHEEP
MWRGGASGCGVGASRCSGFSCCGAQAVAEGFAAQRHVGVSWIRGRVRCPALAGIFLTSGPPEYIMRNAGLEEAQAGIKIAGRNINNLRYADDTTLMAESEEELKSLLMKVKEMTPL